MGKTGDDINRMKMRDKKDINIFLLLFMIKAAAWVKIHPYYYIHHRDIYHELANDVKCFFNKNYK
jgi:hypothetical protein